MSQLHVIAQLGSNPKRLCVSLTTTVKKRSQTLKHKLTQKAHCDVKRTKLLIMTESYREHLKVREARDKLSMCSSCSRYAD